MLDRRGQLDEAAVAEAAAVRNRAFAIRVPDVGRQREVRRRLVLDAAAADVPARPHVERAGELVEERRERGRLRLHRRLDGVVDREHVRARSRRRASASCGSSAWESDPTCHSLERPGADDAADVPLIAPPDVCRARSNSQPLCSLCSRGLEEQAVAEIAIALVPGGVAVEWSCRGRRSRACPTRCIGPSAATSGASAAGCGRAGACRRSRAAGAWPAPSQGRRQPEREDQQQRVMRMMPSLSG